MSFWNNTMLLEIHHSLRKDLQNFPLSKHRSGNLFHFLFTSPWSRMSAVLRNTVSTELDKSIQHGGSEWPAVVLPLDYNYFLLLASFYIFPSVYHCLHTVWLYLFFTKFTSSPSKFVPIIAAIIGYQKWGNSDNFTIT